MKDPNYIFSLPFKVQIKGNKSVNFHFSNSSRHFNIKCKEENPGMNICLFGSDGSKKEFDFSTENHSINGMGYEIIKFENRSERDIVITLDKEELNT
jgi:hypothetical protein